jgi:hypothetical protein
MYKLHLQQEHIELTGVAGGASEQGKVTYVPGRNTNADCFEATLSASE